MKTQALRPFLLLPALALFLHAQEPPDIVWQDSLVYNFTPTSVAVSPDNLYVAGPGTNGVQLWRASNGERVASISTSINRFSFSPDGRYLATGTDSFFLSLWHTTDWSRAFILTNNVRWGPLAFSPDSSSFAVSQGRAIQLRRTADGSLFHAWTNSPVNPGWDDIVALAFSPDGTRLASGAGIRGKDTHLTLWEIPSGNLLLRIPTAQTYHVGFISFSPDGQWLAAAGGTYAYGPMQLWRTSDMALAHTFPGGAFSGAFTPDSAQLLTMGSNFTFYAVADGREIRRYQDSQYGSRNEKRVAISPDGRTFFRTCYPGHILAARVPVWVHSITQSDGRWQLSWSGGSQLFQVQQRTNLLTGTWQDVGVPSTNLSAVVESTSPFACFRVLALPD